MSEDTIRDSKYSWFRLAVILLLAIVGNAGIWVIIAIMPSVQAEFGIDRAGVSLPYALTMIGFGIGNLFAGRLVDRIGASKAVKISAIAIGAFYALSSVSSSIYLVAILQLFIGLGSGTFFGPMMAEVSHWFLKHRGIAVAITASGNYLSGAIWPLLLSDALVSGGWRFVYVIMAVATVTITLPVALLLRREVTRESIDMENREAAENVRAVKISPAALQWILAFAGVACCVAMSMPQVHIVSYCVDLGFGTVVGAEMLSLMLLGGVVSRLVSGALADKLGGVLTLLIGSTLQCVSLFLYLPFDGLASLYVVSLVFGLSQGGIVPGYAIVAREFLPAHEAGERIGFIMMATILGMALGGWLSGLIYDWTGSYQIAFVNGIAWNLLNMAIIATLLFRSRSKRLAGANPA